MSDPNTPRSFFDEPEANTPLPTVATARPAPVVSPSATGSITQQKFAPAKEPVALIVPKGTSTPAQASQRRKSSGVSTWIVGLPAIVFLTLAPSNPSLGVLIVGIAVLITGLYAVATGRPSWAHISSRRAAAAPIVLAVALLVLAPMLPSSLVVSPRFLTAPPSPNLAQEQTLFAQLTAIDPRFSSDYTPEVEAAKINDVCVNDFASQTPDYEVAEIRQHLVFSNGKPLTSAQSLSVLDAVRSSYCGEPGSRDATTKTTLSYSITGFGLIAETIYDQLTGKPAPGAVTPTSTPTAKP